jgi:hypothetical protein
MRKFILIILLVSGFAGNASNIPTTLKTENDNAKENVIPPAPAIGAQQLTTLRVKDFEKITGRKMSLKEKLAYKLMQVKLKKDMKKKGKGDYSARSKTAFILSILSLATILLLPLSVLLAVISIILASKSLKANPEDRKAKTAMGLSILALGIIVVGLLIYGIFVSDGAFKLFVIN